MDDKKLKEKILDELDFKAATPYDCTGLLPFGYGTEDDLSEYNEIYNFIQEPIVEKSMKE